MNQIQNSLLKIISLSALIISSSFLHGQAVITVSDATVTEGDAGTTTLNFTVSCDPCMPINAIIDWRINDGTATTADNDYIDKSGQIDDIGNGNTAETVSITVEINGDTKVEPDETIELELYNASVGSPSLVFQDDDRFGTGTIINDDVEEAGGETGDPGDSEKCCWWCCWCVWLIIIILLLALIYFFRKRKKQENS